jgi:CheY-like chemotaxis protein
MRHMLTLLLERAGYAVTSVEDGLLAWQALQTERFDLLVTDNDMPNLTGIQLVTKLRQKKLPIPAILASGSAGFYSGEEYRWLRFSACLQKPFAPAHLVDSVQLVLGAASLAASSASA